MGARVCLGAFAGAHGVKGDAKVKTFTEAEDGVARYGPVESEDGKRRFVLTFVRVLKPGLALVRAPEIASREDAEALAGTRIYVDREKLPPPADDEFYLDDLVGLAAVDDGGRSLGRIAAFYDFGAGDVLEIEASDGSRTMVPFSRAAVPAVDLVKGVVTIAAEALRAETADEGDA